MIESIKIKHKNFSNVASKIMQSMDKAANFFLNTNVRLVIYLFIWLVILRIYVALAVFQPYRNLVAGDNQSLKFKCCDRESNPVPLAPQAKGLTTRPPQLPTNVRCINENKEQSK